MTTDKRTPAAQLADAIYGQEKLFREAIDRLRDLASPETENEVYDLTSTLRDAIKFAGCLRRLVPDRTAREIHLAFGAPGDFGYEHPVGIALARVYGLPVGGDDV